MTLLATTYPAALLYALKKGDYVPDIRYLPRFNVFLFMVEVVCGSLLGVATKERSRNA